jgi:hypothetical protein
MKIVKIFPFFTQVKIIILMVNEFGGIHPILYLGYLDGP